MAMVGSISEFISEHSEGSTGLLEERLGRVLHAIRTHLGMDVAFVSEFRDGHRVFRHVDAAAPDEPIKVGDSDPLETTYCQRVVDGRLPELMPDASLVAEARALPVTEAHRVGAHLSVPIKLKDSSVYGTFCCISHTPDESMNERDIGMMRVFAEFAAEQIERDLETRQSRQVIESRINAVLSGDNLSMVYQPIYQTKNNRIVGFESLARFSATPARTPDLWFKEASEVGLGVQLETEAIRRALLGLDHLPPHTYVSVNVSPEVVIEGNLADVLNGSPLDRVVLEITEHAAVNHYSELSAVLRPLHEKGLRIAVDDVGAGYANFLHILSLTPDMIKLDISITRNIDSDAPRRALAKAFSRFARETRCKVVAEGVETASELSTLRELSVENAQGYYLARPMALESAMKLA